MIMREMICGGQSWGAPEYCDPVPSIVVKNKFHVCTDKFNSRIQIVRLILSDFTDTTLVSVPGYYEDTYNVLEQPNPTHVIRTRVTVTIMVPDILCH